MGRLILIIAALIILMTLMGLFVCLRAASIADRHSEEQMRPAAEKDRNNDSTI